MLLALVGCAPSVLEVDPHPSNPMAALATVHLRQDAEVAVAWTVDGTERSTPVRAVSAEEPSTFRVLGLHPDQAVELSVVDSEGKRLGKPVTWTAGSLPEDFPACAVTFDAGIERDPEEVVCAAGNGKLSEGQGLYFCVDHAGHPAWMVRHPTGTDVQDFQVLSDGTLAVTSFHSSVLVLMDQDGELLSSYPQLWLRGRTRYAHEFIDGHEVIELVEGPWAGALAVLTATTELLPGGGERVGNGIVVLDPVEDEVLWDWSSLGHSTIDGLTIDPHLDFHRYGLTGVGDWWMHANALLHRVRDGRQEFWVSSRYQDWIFAVDVQTDAIRWRLGYQGDFDLVEDLDAEELTPLQPGQWMFTQHAPEWLPGQGDRVGLLLFDNGEDRPIEGYEEGAWSRILALEIDEERGLAAPTFEWGGDVLPEGERFFSTGGGDADRVRDGTRLYAVKAWDGPSILEVSYPEGELLWRLECEEEYLYRTTWLPSLYEMTWRYR